jgi:UTP--glucose-1-phosphate uridylyltransferase
MERGGGVFACKRAESDAEYGSYGFAAGENVDDGLIKMSEIIEKPGSREAAPSDLASVSNYLLPAGLMSYVEEGVKHHTAGEFTFQPFVQAMINDGHDFYAYEIKDAKFHDTGNPLEYLKTSFDFGLRHPKFGDELRSYIQQKLDQ